MNIKIVPANKPKSEGRWIKVADRPDDRWHFRFPQLAEIYAADIPKGYVAVQFTKVAPATK